MEAVESQQFVNRSVLGLADEVPHSDFYTGKRVIGLQEVQAVCPHGVYDFGDVLHCVQRLSQDRVENWVAGTVGHRTDQTGDGGQGGRLTLAPSGESSRADPHQDHVLASVRDVKDLRHGKVEQVDSFDLHEEAPLESTPALTPRTSLASALVGSVRRRPAT